TPAHEITPPNALDVPLVQAYYQGTTGQTSTNQNAPNATPSEQFIEAVKSGLSQGNLLEQFQEISGGYEPQLLTDVKFNALAELALTPEDYISGGAVEKMIEAGVYSAGELGVGSSSDIDLSGEAASTLDVLKNNPNRLFKV